jgi:2-polyprenyl-3-methyl-5-hydroxy-6-metoxy-1,4-benzoquinol methylase
LVNCGECGTYWVYPNPNEKKLSEIYSESYHYRNNILQDKLFEIIYKKDIKNDYNLILKYKKRGRVLDVGAGRGDLLAKFKSSDWDRWAYDPYISKSDLAKLSRKIGNNINNFSDLDKYPKNTFDLIILRNIIEHTAETDKLVKSIHKILKKGGILFIRTPNLGSIDFYLFRNNWYVVNMDGHVIFWDISSMHKMLLRYGLVIQVAQATSFSYPLSLFRSVTKIKSKWLRLMTSLAFFGVSGLIKNGGDMLVIAKK